ncbi:hypothetical protein [Micromonospora parastrephiae]|uniref:hypothetical protein n=1 Tax=Micromonospora parastrephiae TaxID=2806101 RepID=UPI001EE3D921|nr:hypothetical protein [Micromonospora parastrephiae]
MPTSDVLTKADLAELRRSALGAATRWVSPRTSPRPRSRAAWRIRMTPATR